MSTNNAHRIVFTPQQTQALVSLLCTVGTFVSIDVRQPSDGSVEITYYDPRYSTPPIWRVDLDGETRELSRVQS